MKTQMKHWDNGSLLNLILGMAIHGAATATDFRDMVAAKDELKRRGIQFSEIKDAIEAVKAA